MPKLCELKSAQQRTERRAQRPPKPGEIEYMFTTSFGRDLIELQMAHPQGGMLLSGVDNQSTISVCRALLGTSHENLAYRVFHEKLRARSDSWATLLTSISMAVQQTRTSVLDLLDNSPQFLDFLNEWEGMTAPAIPTPTSPETLDTPEITTFLHVLTHLPCAPVFWDTLNRLKLSAYKTPKEAAHTLANMIVHTNTTLQGVYTPTLGDVTTKTLDELTVFSEDLNTTMTFQDDNLLGGIGWIIHTTHQVLHEDPDHPVLDDTTPGVNKSTLEAAQANPTQQHTLLEKLRRYHRAHQLLYTCCLVRDLVNRKEGPVWEQYRLIMSSLIEYTHEDEDRVWHIGDVDKTVLFMLAFCGTLTDHHTVHVHPSAVRAFLRVAQNIHEALLNPAWKDPLWRLMRVFEHVSGACFTLFPSGVPWKELVTLPGHTAATIFDATPTSMGWA